MSARITLALLLLLFPIVSQGLSLYPLRNPVERIEPALAVDRPAELIAEQWRPYGLAGVTVSGLQLRGSRRPVSVGIVAVSQSWGDLRAESAELELTLGSPLRCGLAFRWERVAGGQPGQAISLLLGGGAGVACGLRVGLWASESGEEDPGAALCSLVLGSLTLQLLLRAANGEGSAEGVGVRWRREELELGLLFAGGAEAATWQELSLGWQRDRWGLSFKTRVHPRLGTSRGVAFRVR